MVVQDPRNNRQHTTREGKINEGMGLAGRGKKQTGTLRYAVLVEEEDIMGSEDRVVENRLPLQEISNANNKKAEKKDNTKQKMIAEKTEGDALGNQRMKKGEELSGKPKNKVQEGEGGKKRKEQTKVKKEIKNNKEEKILGQNLKEREEMGQHMELDLGQQEAQSRVTKEVKQIDQLG